MGRVSENTRATVYKRDNYKCRYCGCGVQRADPYAEDAATVDHVKPLAKGGLSVAGNLKTACRACNMAKANMSLSEYKAAGMPRHHVRLSPAACLKRGWR